MSKKYAIAGASSRALNMYIQPITSTPEFGKIVVAISYFLCEKWFNIRYEHIKNGRVNEEEHLQQTLTYRVQHAESRYDRA